MSKLDESLKRLERWTGALASEVRAAIPAIRQALDPKATLPRNCSSHQSFAELSFRGVKKKLEEIDAAVKAVEDAIRDIGR